jgi:hypothetical protein
MPKKILKRYLKNNNSTIFIILRIVNNKYLFRSIANAAKREYTAPTKRPIILYERTRTNHRVYC